MDCKGKREPNASDAIPPLEADEKKLLVINCLLSQALMLVIGVVAAVIATGCASSDWLATIFDFLWVRYLAESCSRLSLGLSVGLGVGLAALIFVIVQVIERLAHMSDAGRKAVLDTRQGFDGEAPRLPIPALAVIMALTGLAEELVFRYAIFTLLFGLLASIVPYAAVALIALALSTVAFTLIHVRYRDIFSLGTVALISLVLGVTFLATGSLFVVALAHALYDFGGMVLERLKMKRNPDYFGGPAPTRWLLDQKAGNEDEERVG